MRTKKQKRKTGRIVLLIIIAIVLAFAVYVFLDHFLGNDGDSGESEVAVTEGEPYEPDTSADPVEPEEDDSPFDASIRALWYFNEENFERYTSFLEKNPRLPIDDVIWMVEANLDMQPYSDAVAAIDHDSKTALVNKFHYLADDFSPSNLVEIDSTMLLREAADAMEEMIRAGASEGHTLWVQSGYRSFTAQTSIYNQYSANDGQEVADTYSARPGHSEHQMGLAADFNTITDAFGETPEGQWAAEYSWIFGYIMRYTEENTDITLYRPEPWHFRYIGKEAAQRYHEEEFVSYEEYWVKYVKYYPPGMEPTDESDESSDESSNESEEELSDN